MQVVGFMCARDEADLLPEVLPHVRGLVDEVFAYDDGSVDGSWDILKSASYAIRREDDKNRLAIDRPNYHHLLERVKKEYDYKREDVWVILPMADRFFLNKTPRQIIVSAEAADKSSVMGIQLDFLRHRADPWTKENDTFPNWTPSIRETCRWFRYDEKCVVAYKVTDETSYLRSKFPWPKGIGISQFGEVDAEGRPVKQLSLEMPFLEHQGRRSPKAKMWQLKSGSRVPSVKRPCPDFSTWENVKENWKLFFDDYKMFPYVDVSSLEPMIKWHNLMIEPEEDINLKRKWFFRGLETAQLQNPLPKRIV